VTWALPGLAPIGVTAERPGQVFHCRPKPVKFWSVNILGFGVADKDTAHGAAVAVDVLGPPQDSRGVVPALVLARFQRHLAFPSGDLTRHEVEQLVAGGGGQRWTLRWEVLGDPGLGFSLTEDAPYVADSLTCHANIRTHVRW
jgi:hypothetical protein